MSIQIKLDASAVNALFPEGSEARVTLARCVVEQVVKSLQGKNISSVTAEVLSEMKPQLDEIKSEMLKHVETLITSGTWNRALTGDARQMIATTAKNFIDGQVKDLVLGSAENYIADKDEVESRVQFWIGEKMRMTDHYIEQHADRLVRAKLEAALKSVSLEQVKQDD